LHMMISSLELYTEWNSWIRISGSIEVTV
jgi:hypothetical protein